jgi:hypothetical protein
MLYVVSPVPPGKSQDSTTVSFQNPFIIHQLSYHSYRMFQEERSIILEVILSAIISKNSICTCVLFRTVSETAMDVIARIKERLDVLRGATRHVLTRFAKCIDVDGGIFENVLH